MNLRPVYGVGMSERADTKGTTKDGAFAGFVLGLALAVFAVINGGTAGALIGLAVAVVSLVVWLSRRGVLGSPSRD